MDNGEMRDLLRAAASERFAPYVAPQWTPDGRSVLLRKRTPNELWLVPTTGAQARKLDVAVRDWSFGAVGQISIHPAGRRIAFLSGDMSNEVMVLENFLPTRSRTFAERAPPTLTTRLGDRAVWTGPKVDLFGRVSPDGRYISFTDWAGFGNLALHQLTSNTDRTLSGSKGWGNEDPNWGEAEYSAVSPDGESVAYGWINQRLREIRIVPVSDANVRQARTVLTFNPDEVRFLGVRDWSPDGKLLAVGTARSDGTMT